MAFKECTHCKKSIPDEAKFCGYCGKELEDEYIATERDTQHTAQPQHSAKQEKQKEKPAPPQTKIDTDKTQIRPWPRFWARQFDYALFGFAIAIVAVFVYPELLQVPGMGFGLLTVFLWTFVEAFLLSTWGTTLGKWFCRIVVRDSTGKKLSYSAALGRSFNVWVKGIGFGIPIVAMITEIVAYNKLTANGKTTWDAEGDFKVTHSKIGFIRAFFMILLMVAYYALTYAPGE